MRYDRAKSGLNQKDAQERRPGVDLPQQMETVDDGSSEYTDGQGFKAPNQLFEKLQKKLEMKAT